MKRPSKFAAGYLGASGGVSVCCFSRLSEVYFRDLWPSIWPERVGLGSERRLVPLDRGSYLPITDLSLRRPCARPGLWRCNLGHSSAIFCPF